MEELFDLFDGFLKDKGCLAMGGQIIVATIVCAPKRHNSREENEAIKDGKTPKNWKRKPAKNRQSNTLCFCPSNWFRPGVLLWRFLAGFRFQLFGVLPSLIASFSSRELCRLGAQTIAATMILPAHGETALIF